MHTRVCGGEKNSLGGEQRCGRDRREQCVAESNIMNQQKSITTVTPNDKQQQQVTPLFQNRKTGEPMASTPEKQARNTQRERTSQPIKASRLIRYSILTKVSMIRGGNVWSGQAMRRAAACALMCVRGRSVEGAARAID